MSDTMFRSIKKRVKSLGDGSRHRAKDTDKLNTPARVPSTDSSLGGGVSAASVTPSSSGSEPPKKVVKSKGSLSMREQEDLTSKIQHLASFDKCIETLDAITASAQQSVCHHACRPIQFVRF